MSMESAADRFVNDYSGFFDGAEPSHADVDDYFTHENFKFMFNDFDGLPDELTWDALKAAAHSLIESND